MELKKILITCENYYPIGGGIQQYHRALAKKLAERGLEVHIMHMYNPEVPEKRDLWGAKVHNSKLLTGALSDPFGVIEKTGDVAKFIKKLNPDLVYANNHNSLAVIKACKLINTPVVYGCHGVGLLCPLKIRFLKPDEEICYNERGFLNCFKCFRQLNNWSGEWMRKNIKSALKYYRQMVHVNVRKYNMSESIISSAEARLGNSALSASLFRQKKNTYGIPLLLEYEGEHAYYPVGASRFKAKYKLGRYIIVSGRLSNIKGQEYAAEALKYMNEDIKLVLAGNAGLWLGDKMDAGAYGEKIKKLIEESGLKDRVIFTGRLELEELREAYSGALAAVVPSVWLETFGYAAIEPLACESPVILTENCGAAECVDENCGAIIPRKDPQAIAGALNKIIPKSEEMGKAGRKKLLNEFNPDILTDRTLEVFKKAMRK